ncbi:hypothetical protein [Tsukamurella paurometabola]|uniref:Uncharacterized protein n=1 Tax=Tsukamurella paurometabola TaxID=2061 RepID=A0A3P8MC40_TSUPA|nr:hypothetical protein [Tsukamurella paurometabola]MBS4102598.1 hypothetical protein [Tsukamurella paurometabola]UEA81676.1 hypothetical protein LK411_14895 [Tsukamurella paurometabola]VDR38686.1 Uncharacterised protein [Tsukamurella paurometabola]
MSFRRVESGGAEPAQATDWIADATRRLAGLAAPDGEAPEIDPRWGADAIDRLREAVAQQVSALPRRSRPIATVRPGVSVTELALSKAVTAALSDRAAAESAAVADVELDLADDGLSAVHVHLVAVGADERPHTLLDGGEHLRALTADVVRRMVGADDVRIDLTWGDLLTPEPI